MTQAPQVVLPEFFSFQDLHLVSATIEITVNHVGMDWSYSLSGGSEEEGWIASGQTITLSPAPDQPQPVLYHLHFSFNEPFMLAIDGLQISLSPGTAVSAASVSSSPLKLIHDLTSGSQELNLGLFVSDISNLLSPVFHEFQDPTIVFDPPQT